MFTYNASNINKYIKLNDDINIIIVDNDVEELPNHFCYRFNISKVIFKQPSKLKVIHDYCLSSCHKLEELELPDSVEHIGEYFCYNSSIV